MKKNYKLLATLVLSGLAGAAFGVLCTGQRILDTKSQKLDVKKINK